MSKIILIALTLMSSSAFASMTCFDVYNYTNDPVRRVCISHHSPKILTIGIKNARCMSSSYEVAKTRGEDAYTVKRVLGQGCGGLLLEKGAGVYIDSVRDITNPAEFIISMTFNTTDGTYILPAELSN